MAARRGSRIIKPLLYTTGAVVAGGTVLYISYRPRDIPGLEAAQVPPPTYGDGGSFRLPAFPAIKTRDEQIADLKRSSRTVTKALEKAKSSIAGLFPGGGATAKEEDTGQEEPYDLLVIGGGATGTGIALDAATRGLKVAIVERDDFSSGTSSKSTKLVHGGVRYLEKAVWELDYSQYVCSRESQSTPLTVFKIQTRQGSIARTTVLSRHCPPPFDVVADHDSTR
jgi:glycerol-3-phosphate dehydrogenase